MGGFTVASSPSPMRVTVVPVVRMLMRMMVLAPPVMMRCLLDVLALCHL